jgi:hypothetical protein
VKNLDLPSKKAKNVTYFTAQTNTHIEVTKLGLNSKNVMSSDTLYILQPQTN